MCESTPGSEMLENALDYLLSAAEYLTLKNSRSYKYAILHAFAGIELLLKERLRREHWSLIFKEVDKANSQSLNSGDLLTVDFKACCERLKDIAKVTIGDQERRKLDNLRTLRNRLQHFHAVLDESDVTSQLFFAVGFSIGFIAKQIGNAEDNHKTVLAQLHQRLASLQKYVVHRMNEIRPELGKGKVSVICPRCSQSTLALGNGDPSCPFCGYSDEAFEAMLEATGGAVVVTCRHCGGPMGEYLYSCEDEVFECFICFACGSFED